jgi:excisionase family DNA binding protein
VLGSGQVDTDGSGGIEMDKLVLNIPEAAKAVSLSPWTIRKWIAQGKLRATRLGRRVCITPEELRKLVERGTRKKGK